MTNLGDAVLNVRLELAERELAQAKAKIQREFAKPGASGSDPVTQAAIKRAEAVAKLEETLQNDRQRRQRDAQGRFVAGEVKGASAATQANVKAAVAADAAWEKAHAAQARAAERAAAAEVRTAKTAADAQTRAAAQVLAATRKREEAQAAQLAGAINRANPGALAARQRQSDALITGARTSDNIFKRFANTVDGADVKLQRFGITSRDLSVILGAGLAGGVAFAIRSFAQLIGSSIQLAATLEKLQSLSVRIFGESSGAVEDFAKRAVEGLGLARSKAIEFQNAFGQILTNSGLEGPDALKVSQSLTTLTVALARATPGRTTQEAFEALAAIFRNEFDPIEKFIGGLKQLEINQKAVDLGLARSTSEVSRAASTQAALILVRERSKNQLAELAGAEGDLGSQTETFAAQVEELQIALGEALLPTVIEVIKNVNLLLGPLVGAARLVEKLTDALDKASEKGESGFLENLARAGAGFLKGGVLGAIRALTGARNKAKEITDEVITQEEILALQIKDAADRTEEYAKAVESLADKRTQLVDAELRYNRALADSERNVDRAERNLARVREDSARKVTRAERDVIRARRDAAKANEQAEQRLSDERKQRVRDIRDAREKLTDFEKDSLKQVQDAERSLLRAIQARADAIADAERSQARARRDGNDDAENEAAIALARAKRDISVEDSRRRLEEERLDRMEQLSRLERELSEVRQDSAEKVRRAQRELFDQIQDGNERVADAQENATDAYREQTRAVFDAQQALDDAIREGAESVFDAATAFQRLRKEVEKLIEAMRELLGLKGDSPAPFVPKFVLPFQHGGPIRRGQTGFVGEAGPELFTPDTNGRIISNDDLAKAFRQAFAGQNSGTTQIVVNEVANDPQATAFAVARELSLESTR